ncbi:complex III assembly factor LYRM7 [Euwallacea fornicatus]|uniref:complex III assembly factor LYRM7 n=1 Tax=Euwallacea fornicatus TaxID=995702 RepID=UPI003390552E
MSNSLRREVLNSFKALHRARKTVFKGDERALTEGRKRINEEFKKQKHVQNETSIQELINYAQAVECELRMCVIQAKEVSPGVYQAEIREDTPKLENVSYKDECCSNLGNKNTTESASKTGS